MLTPLLFGCCIVAIKQLCCTCGFTSGWQVSAHGLKATAAIDKYISDNVVAARIHVADSVRTMTYRKKEYRLVLVAAVGGYVTVILGVLKQLAMVYRYTIHRLIATPEEGNSGDGGAGSAASKEAPSVMMTQRQQSPAAGASEDERAAATAGLAVRVATTAST